MSWRGRPATATHDGSPCVRFPFVFRLVVCTVTAWWADGRRCGGFYSVALRRVAFTSGGRVCGLAVVVG